MSTGACARLFAVKGEDYLERILRARVYDVAEESPLELAPALSRRLGNRLLLKREDLQPVFSFKLRGAYNKMAGLPRDKLRKGVIAASAGNHAQGVALAAQKLGCRATIVMPVTTPRIKVDAVAQRGARVVLTGDSYDEAYAHAMQLRRRHGYAFVHPYDDPEVIAGQGTIGMEILRQSTRPIDADPEEPERFARPAVALIGDARPVLRRLIDALPGRQRRSRRAEMQERQARMRKRLAKLAPQIGFIDAIRAALPEDGIFVDEVTQIGFAARLLLPVHKPRTFLSPGYQDNLGWGFATAAFCGRARTPTWWPSMPRE